jgi:hypothetical protein
VPDVPVEAFEKMMVYIYKKCVDLDELELDQLFDLLGGGFCFIIYTNYINYEM